MKEEPTNKCKESGLFHSWNDITLNIVYATNPLQYPPKQEQCRNCGLVRTYRENIETWYEYELKEIPKEPIYSVLNLGDNSTDSGTTDMTFLL